MALAKLDLRDIDFDLDGLLNAGGKIYTYAGSGTTPLATYADSDGTVNANPIILDSSGQCHIWLTEDTAYKFSFANANNVVLYTENNVMIRGAGTGGTGQYVDVVLTYAGGPPGSGEWLGGERVTRAVDFEINWSGAFGKIPEALPAASFVVTIKQNNVTVGTATCSTAGVWTFATSAAAVVNFEIGDEIDFYGPATADTTIADFGLTLPGSLAE